MKDKPKANRVAPMSLRLDEDMEKRLTTCAEKLKISKHGLAQAAVEALVEACEAHDHRLVFPVELVPLKVPAPLTAIPRRHPRRRDHPFRRRHPLQSMNETTPPAPLDAEDADILNHTARTGRYVGEGHRLMSLAARGLLHDHGPQPLAGGAHFLTLSASGRAALNAWRAAQPKPPAPRRRSRDFEAWRDYCEAVGRVSFTFFLRSIKPRQNFSTSQPLNFSTLP